MVDKPTNNTNEYLLTLEDKGTSSAKGILSMIFRKILADRNVNSTLWNKLMQGYLNDPNNRVPHGSRCRSSTRGNLNKELSKPKMTWQNFEKGIRFLNPKKARFILKLTWHNGTVSTHEITLKQAEETAKPMTVDHKVQPPITPTQLALLSKIGHDPFTVIPAEQQDLDMLEDEGFILRFEVLGEKVRGQYQRQPAWALTEQGHTLIDQYG